MIDDIRVLQEMAHVDEIVAQWGEGFREAASNPRFVFDGSEIRISLWKPITHGGETIDTLTFREPTLDDLQKSDGLKGDILRTRRLIVSTCGITDREAGTIGMRDMMLIGILTAAFTDAAPATGSTV